MNTVKHLHILYRIKKWNLLLCGELIMFLDQVWPLSPSVTTHPQTHTATPTPTVTHREEEEKEEMKDEVCMLALLRYWKYSRWLEEEVNIEVTKAEDIWWHHTLRNEWCLGMIINDLPIYFERDHFVLSELLLLSSVEQILGH